jgi:nitrogen PTS system EIIA component
MKSLLNALDEGRLVELPDPDKTKALEYLALLLEAIPDISTRSDIVAEVKAREASGSTALGKGIACPHARRPGEGDLLCAVGWSPQGIDYGAPDNEKVHLVIMYYIPDSQRNLYLKEISGLAKAVTKTEGIAAITTAADIHVVRNQLLDWVALTMEAAMPDAKARMIKLQASAPAAPDKGRQPLSIVPFSVLVAKNQKPVVLSRENAFVQLFESQAALAELLRGNEQFGLEGYQVVVRSMATFAQDRCLYECLSVKLEG